MMTLIIAIDPGASGGIAWRDADGIVNAEPMPEGMTAQADFIRELIASTSGTVCVAVIERTGTYVPGNSGVAASTFARHCGHIEMACYCFGIPATQIAPTVWQKPLGLPKDKSARKLAIKELMQRKYPHLKVTLKTADALALLSFAEASNKWAQPGDYTTTGTGSCRPSRLPCSTPTRSTSATSTDAP